MASLALSRRMLSAVAAASTTSSATVCSRAVVSPSSSSSSAFFHSSPSSFFFVKVHGNLSNASRDMERLSSKVEASGIEKVAQLRKRYVKPHLMRQRNAKGAVFNKAKQERIKLVEEMMLDRNVSGF